MSVLADKSQKCDEVNEFLWPIRVYYEDTDAGGVVYYANYLKFMERTRTEWLRSLGFVQEKLAQEEGVVFVVRHAEIDYRRPARLDNLLVVSGRVISHKKASMIIEHEIRLEDSGAVLCHGQVVIVCVHAETFRPHPFPKRLLAEMSNGN